MSRCIDFSMKKAWFYPELFTKKNMGLVIIECFQARLNTLENNESTAPGYISKVLSVDSSELNFPIDRKIRLDMVFVNLLG
jgi:hypothetical protein